MKKYILPAIVIPLIIGCTSNPIGDDNISSIKNRIEGEILLDSNNQPEKVYVWLEEFSIGAYSEPDGSFSLSLPPGLNSDVNGLFKLYFYVSNFTLYYVEVAIRNGEFIPNEAALGINGKLRQNVELEQFLSIKTVVSPTSVAPVYTGSIRIQSDFQASSEDTTTIVIPNSIGHFLGPLFFKNVATDQSYIFTGISLESKAIIIVGNTPISRTVTFLFNSLGLPPGSYKVVPVFSIKHQEIPAAMLNSIDENLDLVGNYFKRPTTFFGGEFEVK